ncbi:hypothetical protein D3C85_1524000 [compost metagenome]
MRSRSWPCPARIWRIVNSRLAHASSQADGAVITISHLPRKDASGTASPRSLVTFSGGIGRSGSTSVP